jgi:hypothetical protein
VSAGYVKESCPAARPDQRPLWCGLADISGNVVCFRWYVVCFRMLLSYASLINRDLVAGTPHRTWVTSATCTGSSVSPREGTDRSVSSTIVGKQLRPSRACSTPVSVAKRQVGFPLVVITLSACPETQLGCRSVLSTLPTYQT